MSTTNDPTETIDVKHRDLVLGDRVRFFTGPFGWGTVFSVDATIAKVARPYIHVGDETKWYGGPSAERHLIHYTGIEEVRLYRMGDRSIATDKYTHDRLLKAHADAAEALRAAEAIEEAKTAALAEALRGDTPP